MCRFYSQFIITLSGSREPQVLVELETGVEQRYLCALKILTNSILPCHHISMTSLRDSETAGFASLTPRLKSCRPLAGVDMGGGRKGWRPSAL